MGVTCERVRDHIREIGEMITDLQDIADKNPIELQNYHADELTQHFTRLVHLINTIKRNHQE